MPTYSGLCIGGPLAGQHIEHVADWYDVPFFPDPIEPVDHFDASQTFQRYTYRWRQWHTGPHVFGLWAAPDTDVMAVLLETYAATVRPVTPTGDADERV